MAFCVVFVTVSNLDEAQGISLALLKEKLAACVSVAPGIISRYWWKGKIEKASESLLIIKTSRSKTAQLIRKVKKIHSYSVPEIIAFPIVGGNPDYLSWMAKCLR